MALCQVKLVSLGTGLQDVVDCDALSAGLKPDAMLCGKHDMPNIVSQQYTNMKHTHALNWMSYLAWLSYTMAGQAL